MPFLCSRPQLRAVCAYRLRQTVVGRTPLNIKAQFIQVLFNYFRHALTYQQPVFIAEPILNRPVHSRAALIRKPLPKHSAVCECSASHCFRSDVHNHMCPVRKQIRISPYCTHQKRIMHLKRTKSRKTCRLFESILLHRGQHMRYRCMQLNRCRCTLAGFFACKPTEQHRKHTRVCRRTIANRPNYTAAMQQCGIARCGDREFCSRFKSDCRFLRRNLPPSNTFNAF